MEELREWTEFDSDIIRFFNSHNGQAAKKLLAFCRLWCVVELASAVSQNIPVVVKGGKAKQKISFNDDGTKSIINNTYFFKAEKDVAELLNSLQRVVNVEESECTVESDKIRELDFIRQFKGGIAEVNRVTEGVLCGAEVTVPLKLVELDAAVCGEVESFEKLNFNLLTTGQDYNIALNNFKGAVSGGRICFVQYILINSI